MSSPRIDLQICSCWFGPGSMQPAPIGQPDDHPYMYMHILRRTVRWKGCGKLSAETVIGRFPIFYFATIRLQGRQEKGER